MPQGDWGAKRTTSGVPSFFFPFFFYTDIGIVDGALAFTGATDGFQGAMPVARPANSDQMRIGVRVLDPTPTPAWAGICGKADWSQQVMMGIRTTGVEIHSSTAFDSSTPRAVSPPTPIVHGDILWLQRNVEDDGYYVFRGTAEGISGDPLVGWADSGHIIAHGTDYRLGVIRLQRTGAVNSARLDDIRLQAAAPLVIGVVGGFPYTFPVDLGDQRIPPAISLSLVPNPPLAISIIIPAMPSTTLIPAPTVKFVALPLAAASTSLAPVPASKPVAFPLPALAATLAPTPTPTAIALPLPGSSASLAPVPVARPVASPLPAISLSVSPPTSFINNPVPPALSTTVIPVPTTITPIALSSSLIPVPGWRPVATPLSPSSTSLVPTPNALLAALPLPALSPTLVPVPTFKPLASPLPASSLSVGPVPTFTTIANPLPGSSTSIAPVPLWKYIAQPLPAISATVGPVPTIPTPVAYDTVGTGSAGNTQSALAAATTMNKTWSHSVAADANCLTLELACFDITYTDPSISTHSRTVTYNGVAMVSQGATGYPAYGFIEIFRLLDGVDGVLAKGANTVSVTVNRTSGAGSQPWVMMCDSISAKNVVSTNVGTAQAAGSGAPSATVNSTPTSLTVGLLAASVNNPGGYNKTSRSSMLSAAHYIGLQSHLLIGTAAGASPTVTHSESSSGNVVLAQAISLNPT